MPTDSVQSHLSGLIDVVDGQPRLLGSRCGSCGTETFPVQSSCPRCSSEDVEPVELATRGTVWTWTVQRFAPKPPFRAPKVFQPFALGYVDLGTVRVEARLGGKPVEQWKIGDPVRLVVGVLDDDDETGWQAFWFEAVTDGQEGQVR